MALTLWELLTAAASGGVGAKLADWTYEEWTRRSTESRSARQVVEQHLDPVLKSADELVGKIRSLALADFPAFGSPKSTDAEIEFLSTMYLFAQFWAWLEILRRESVYVVLSSVQKGRHLREFMATLESTRVRLVSRSLQRGIGGALIEFGDKPRVVSLYEFAKRWGESQASQLRQWLGPLEELLMKPQHKAHRQRILVYCAVVHAMLDTIDPDHRATRKRPGWGNKLTKRSRRELEARTFRVYLPFVDRPHTYTRPPIK